MNNQTIRLAIWVTRISKVLLVLFYTIMMAIIIYWFIEPASFIEWELTAPLSPGSMGFRFNQTTAGTGVPMDELSRTTMTWLAIRATLFFVLVWLGLGRVLKVLLSVKANQTFFRENVRHFQQLSTIGILFTILSAFNFGGAEGGGVHVNFSIPFIPLLFTLGCYVLAEIFREGGRLREDSSSII